MSNLTYQIISRTTHIKPYRIYMMASANKFLRIYYATVKAYLESLEHTARSRHKALAGRRFKFEMRSGLVWSGLFAHRITLKFLLDFS